jgi:hypothetical protein
VSKQTLMAGSMATNMAMDRQVSSREVLRFMSLFWHYELGMDIENQ